MNIYVARINELPTWLVEAESLVKAMSVVLADIQTAPADSDFQELSEAKEAEIYIHLAAEGKSLAEFEKDHPAIYGGFF